MRRRVTLTALAMLTIALFLGTASWASENETTFGTGINFEWWSSDDSDHGTQTYTPITASVEKGDFSLELLGAFAYTSVKLSHSDSESLAAFTDTRLNCSYSLMGKLPVDVLFGLGLNLPTGHTDLSNDELALVQPPELMPISTFGEGFNVNPTLVFAREMGPWVAGMGFGYTYRGEYDYSEYVQDYDPGDILSITAEVGRDLTPELYARVFGEYMSYGRDKVDGEDDYQQGAMTVAGLGLKYTLPESVFQCTLQGILRGKSKALDSDADLTSEPYKSHGDEVVGTFSYSRKLGEKNMLDTNLQLLWIGANDYPSDSTFYNGERTKVTLGCGLTRQLKESLKGTLGLKGFYMDDETNLYHPGEDLTYKGVIFSGTVVMSM